MLDSQVLPPPADARLPACPPQPTPAFLLAIIFAMPGRKAEGRGGKGGEGGVYGVWAHRLRGWGAVVVEVGGEEERV
jgi:hypothetical protein